MAYVLYMLRMCTSFCVYIHVLWMTNLTPRYTTYKCELNENMTLNIYNIWPTASIIVTFYWDIKMDKSSMQESKQLSEQYKNVLLISWEW
jgi:hypothetical protein